MSAQRFLEEALRTIDAGRGSHSVNLRELARVLGCAHTNAYNFFDGLDDLLRQALEAVLSRQMEASSHALAKAGPDPWKRLLGLVDSQVRFATEHPGWYAFLWLEPLRTAPAPETMAGFVKAGDALTALMIDLSGGKLKEPRARELAEDFHTFLHGALCKVIAGRTPPDSADGLRRALKRRAEKRLRAWLESKE